MCAAVHILQSGGATERQKPQAPRVAKSLATFVALTRPETTTSALIATRYHERDDFCKGEPTYPADDVPTYFRGPENPSTGWNPSSWCEQHAEKEPVGRKFSLTRNKDSSWEL